MSAQGIRAGALRDQERGAAATALPTRTTTRVAGAARPGMQPGELAHAADTASG